MCAENPEKTIRIPENPTSCPIAQMQGKDIPKIPVESPEVPCDTEKMKTTSSSEYHRFEFEMINIIDGLIVIMCGISMIMATNNGNDSIVNLIAGGLIGYLGGSARGLIKKNQQPPTTTTTTTTRIK